MCLAPSRCLSEAAAAGCASQDVDVEEAGTSLGQYHYNIMSWPYMCLQARRCWGRGVTQCNPEAHGVLEVQVEDSVEVAEGELRQDCDCGFLLSKAREMVAEARLL